jgi:hypothetical protein
MMEMFSTSQLAFLFTLATGPLNWETSLFFISHPVEEIGMRRRSVTKDHIRHWNSIALFFDKRKFFHGLGEASPKNPIPLSSDLRSPPFPPLASLP